MRLRAIAIIVACFTLGAAVALAIFNYNAARTGGVAMVVGKAQIGGPFSLTDHSGRRVTDKDYRGKYLLIFFGFTYCPDVCPTELQVMAGAIDRLGRKGAAVTPIFITVDPERDTAQELAAYVSNFHDRLVGLTGSAAEISAAAKAYKVYFKKVEDKNSAADYTFDHSSIVFLMGPKGEYLANFAPGTGPDAMAETIARHLQDRTAIR